MHLRHETPGTVCAGGFFLETVGGGAENKAAYEFGARAAEDFSKPCEFFVRLFVEPHIEVVIAFHHFGFNLLWVVVYYGFISVIRLCVALLYHTFGLKSSFFWGHFSV